MATLGDAVLFLRANSDGLNKGLDEAETKTKGWAGGIGGKVGKLIGGAVVGGALLAAGAIVGIGKAALGVEEDFDNAIDAIINGTGASGEALDAMGVSVRNLKTSAAGLGVSMESIGQVMAEVNTRTGASGAELETLTGEILQFSRLTGADAVQTTQLLTRTMGDWGVSMEDSGALLDQLYGAGQAFGISTDALAGKLVQFGAPLRQMGFSLEDSIAMFGKWEKEGVNAELVIGSLRIAAGQFAEEGVDLAQGLRDVQERIKGAASDSEALTIAMETFGARAGPDMAAAIREGRFELDGAIEALRATEGGLADAAERTIGFREQWQIGMAKVADALIPLGNRMAELAGQAMPYVISAIETMIGWLTPLIDRIINLGNYIAPLIAWFQDKLPAAMGATTGRFQFVKAWIDQNMPLIRQTIETVLGAIAAFWTTHGEAIMGVVNRTFETIRLVIDTVMQTVMGIIRTLLLALNGDWAGAWEELRAVVERIWDTIVTVVENQLTSLKDVIFGFAEQLPEWVALMAQFGAAAWQWIADAVPVALGKLGEWAGGLVSGLASSLPGFVAGIYKWATAIVSWIGDAIPKAINKLTEFVANLGKTGDTQGGSVFGEMVGRWVGLLIDWVINDLIPKVGPAFVQFAGALALALGKIAIALGELGLTLANAIVDGIVSGINAGATAISTAVMAAVRGAWEAAKSFLGINSPSKLFAEMGQNTMAGMAQGVTDGESMPLSAVRGAVQRLGAIGDELSAQALSAFGNLAGGGMMRPAMAGAQASTSNTTTNTWNVTIAVEPGGTERDGQRAARGFLAEMRAAGMR